MPSNAKTAGQHHFNVRNPRTSSGWAPAVRAKFGEMREINVIDVRSPPNSKTTPSLLFYIYSGRPVNTTINMDYCRLRMCGTAFKDDHSKATLLATRTTPSVGIAWSPPTPPPHRERHGNARLTISRNADWCGWGMAHVLLGEDIRMVVLSSFWCDLPRRI